MKKILYSILIAGLTLASAACQKVDEKSAKISGDGLKVTATIASFDGTKVNYAFEDASDAKSSIKPTWSVNDEIFGFDSNEGTFTFTVTDVDDSGKATFNTGDYTPVEGATLYAVYYPVKDAEDFEDGELAVDIASQSGILGDDTPVIMCATATVSDGAISFEFANQTAIVGIYRMQIKENDTPVSAGVKISGVSLKGVCAKGTIKVDGGELKLIPGSETETISATGLELTTVANGFIEVGSESIAPYFSVIPGASTMSVEATSADKTYYNVSSIASASLTAGNYYYIGKVLTSPVAKIGTTLYFDIKDAVAAANSATEDVTITMLDNVTITGETDSLKLNNQNKKTVTLELNGRTISAENLKGSVLNVSSDLIINDTPGNGGIINNADVTKARAMFLNKGESVTINGGTFKNVRNTSTVYCVAETVQLNGGTFINASSAGSCPFYMFNASAIVTVDDGNFINVNGGSSAAFRSGSADVTIKGGYFYNSGSSTKVVSVETNNTHISGGYFSSAPNDATLAGGYANKDISASPEKKIVDNEEYIFNFTIEENPAAKIGDEEYLSLELAFEKVKTGETIALLRDYFIGGAISADKEVTLDLNGHTLTSVGTSRRISQSDASGKLTVKNGKLTCNSKSSHTVSVSAGELILESVTVETALAKADTAKTYCPLYITGGKTTVKEDVTLLGVGYYGAVYVNKAGTLDFYGKAKCVYDFGKDDAGEFNSKGIMYLSGTADAHAGVINVYDGAEISGNKGYGQTHGIYNYYGTVNVYGGNIKVSRRPVFTMTGSTANFYGGHMENTANWTLIYLNASTAKVNIQGGYFYPCTNGSTKPAVFGKVTAADYSKQVSITGGVFKRSVANFMDATSSEYECVAESTTEAGKTYDYVVRKKSE